MIWPRKCGWNVLFSLWLENWWYELISCLFALQILFCVETLKYFEISCILSVTFIVLFFPNLFTFLFLKRKINLLEIWKSTKLPGLTLGITNLHLALVGAIICQSKWSKQLWSIFDVTPNHRTSMFMRERDLYAFTQAETRALISVEAAPVWFVSCCTDYIITLYSH